MIKGVLLGVSFSAFFSSLLISILGDSGSLKRSYLTGAAIGIKEVVSYSNVSSIIFFFTTLLLITLILRSKKSNLL